MNPIDELLTLSERYCAATGRREATLSTRLFQDGKRLLALRSGGDVGVRRLQRAMAWLSTNWPQDTEWPPEIERPAATVQPMALAVTETQSGAVS